MLPEPVDETGHGIKPGTKLVISWEILWSVNLVKREKRVLSTSHWRVMKPSEKATLDAKNGGACFHEPGTLAYHICAEQHPDEHS